MRALLILLALAPVANLGAADVYRWTDADGQTHYSDRPHPGAQRVTIAVSPPASGTADRASPSARAEGPDGGTPEPVTNSYQSLTITSPAQEEVLWNIEGQLDVAAAVQPALVPGHVLQFYLDGQMEAADPGETRVQFSEVFRGEHTVRVEVVDDSGNTRFSSPITRFFVRQTALPNPIP